MDLPIVVGVDGSEPSLRAVDWASDEAALRGVPLSVVYACLWEQYERAALAKDLGKASARRLPQEITGAAARRAHDRHPDLTVTSDVLFEEPEYALVRASRNACALVVGSRGRSSLAEALLGAVSLTAAAHAHCPVVVLRGSHDNQATPPVHGRIVVGVGDGAEDSAAVRFAYEEARRRGVPLEAIRAWRCPAHETTDHPLLTGAPAELHERDAEETLAKALRDAPPDLQVHRRTLEGHARRVLVDASHSADLLIVGAKRRAGHLGLQLGRVAHTALHHSACPVAVVPQPA
ncbi:universal stress protein [Streptomyces sp. UG1]|uniref:universal stress protein n=1 Tax=Streptomyces sp. UG1 TaxID=3417652 RepID=UPI003CFB1CE8